MSVEGYGTVLPMVCEIITYVNRTPRNIESFRDVLPKLKQGSDSILEQPVHKTVRLLLGYNVDIIIKVPQSAASELDNFGDSQLGLFPELLGGIPFVRRGLELHASIEDKSNFPVLLGVLTEMC
jgi:hypothetical protein